VDGESYEVLKCVVGFYSPDAMCITDSRAQAFISGDGDEQVVAFGGSSVHEVGVWAPEAYPCGLCADSAFGKLYCLVGWPALVTVIDAKTTCVLANVPLDYSPQTACCNTIDHKVYVAGVSLEDVGELSVLDEVGDSLLTEIAVEGQPTLFACNPNADVVYAADVGSYEIQVISGKGDSVMDWLQVRELPIGLVYDDAQRLLCSLGRDGTVTVIDPATHSVNARIYVGVPLTSFYFNAPRSRLYCGGPGHDSVYVVDCVSDEVVGTIPVSGYPVTFCYNSPRGRLYCAGSAGGGLSVIDCASETAVANVPVNAGYLYYDSTSDAVYCLGEDHLSVIDGQTNRIIRDFPAGSYPAGLASVPGWTCVYACDGDNSYLSVVRKSAGPAEMAVRAAPEAQATIARGSLYFAGKTQAAVFDLSGRRVASASPGRNDVGQLPPGVYFVRERSAVGGQPSAVTKVIVTR
jgi:DNA-binding beta-propeller fold protein YncE